MYLDMDSQLKPISTNVENKMVMFLKASLTH